MGKYIWLLGAAAAFRAAAAHAESYTLTLSQAIGRALAQSPEVVMARTDEMKAIQGVRIAKLPFTPRVGIGSGLAYNNGFPLSIEGSAPSVFETKANQYLFNKPQTYAVAQAKENTRTVGFASAERRDEAVFRVATLFIDVDRAGRLVEGVQKQ